MNVLIVDDDKLARKGLVAIMDWKKYGFEVVGDVQKWEENALVISYRNHCHLSLKSSKAAQMCRT